MMLGSNRDQLMSDINVTPFVDVMLVLLIIFMVTAPMMIQGIDVSLPEATSKPLPAETDQLIITINKNNQIFINDYQIRLDFFREKLRSIIKSSQNKNVYLKADKQISYGMVVRVMSEIKEAGVEKLGMITDPLEEDRKSLKTQKGN